MLDYHLIGDDMQAVVIKLNKGEGMRAEAGALMYMTDGIEMEAKLEGGLLGGIKRKISGESLFIPRFQSERDGAELAFAGPYPGKILAHEMSGELLCQRDSFLCSSGSIDISIAFTKKLGAGFFGGEGFILQKLSGQGLIFLHAGGTITERVLQAGENLRVDTGCLVAFEPTVSYDIKLAGNLKTSLFGGEGLFLAHLTGPGKVVLQTLPFARLAERVHSAFGSSRGEVKRGSAISGILGEVLGGD